ncbi:MAG: tetratricopeptide repeat protein [Gemmatimonadales bacterium]
MARAACLPYARRGKLMEEEGKGRVPPEWVPLLEESFRLRRRAFLIKPLVSLQILGAIVPMQGAVIALDPRQGSVRIGYNPFEAFVRGDYLYAYRQFRDVAERGFPGRGRDSLPEPVLWYRGLAAAHVGLTDSAIADIEALLHRGERAEHADTIVHMPLMTNDYRYLLALLQHRARRWEPAIALYQEALSHDAGLFMAHVQMGRIYEERRMWEQAVAAFRLAVATNPDDPSLLLDLGVVLRQAGRLGDAEDALRQGMAANVRDSRVPYHLGVVLQEAGKPGEAREAFTRFLELAPSRYGPRIADARRRLAELP